MTRNKFTWKCIPGVCETREKISFENYQLRVAEANCGQRLVYSIVVEVTLRFNQLSIDRFEKSQKFQSNWRNLRLGRPLKATRQVKAIVRRETNIYAFWRVIEWRLLGYLFNYCRWETVIIERTEVLGVFHDCDGCCCWSSMKNLLARSDLVDR